MKKNENGSVVALVLIILAVLTLAGAAATMQSRYFMRFSSTMQSYEAMFNLADGANIISFRSLQMSRPEAYPSSTTSKFALPIISNKVPQTGEYAATAQYIGYETDLSKSPGYSSEFYPMYWVARGEGTQRVPLPEVTDTDPNKASNPHSVVDAAMEVYNKR